jgi:hypothetical protein
MPQGMPVRAWQKEKVAEVKPAQRAMSFSGTPNDSIISGTYGKMEVRAMGSAKRHIARRLSELYAGHGTELTQDGQLLGWQAAFCHGGTRGDSHGYMVEGRRKVQPGRRLRL